MAAGCSEGTDIRGAGRAIPGRLVLVVGPSGAGKDTLLRLAQQGIGGDATIVFVRRVVTRPASAAEDNIEASFEDFARAEANGGFALSWSAHGHRYGVSRAIETDLAAGKTVVVNVSRTMIELARRRFGNVLVVYIDARRELRAVRLASRSRESADSIAERLPVDSAGEPETQSCDILIENNGDPRDAALQLAACLTSRHGG